MAYLYRQGLTREEQPKISSSSYDDHERRESIAQRVSNSKMFDVNEKDALTRQGGGYSHPENLKVIGNEPIGRRQIC
jgi:hypothetical protein